MSAGTTVFKKDMRLAASVVVPALGVLAVVLMTTLFGHLIPGIGRILWGSEYEPPVIALRFGVFQNALIGGLYLTSLWTAVVVTQGDRVRRASLLAVVLPISDAGKVVSKVACLTAWAAVFLGMVALNAWLSGRFPTEWTTQSVIAVAAPFCGALCGLAASGLVRSVTAAVMLGLAMPFVGVLLGWCSATALVSTSVGDTVAKLGLPEWLIDEARNSAFEAAAIVAGATWVLLLAAVGCRALAGRPPIRNMWVRIGAPLAIASVAALGTAGVVIYGSGLLPRIRQAITVHDAVRMEMRALTTDRALLKAYGILPAETPRPKGESRSRVLHFLGIGVRGSDILKRPAWTNPSDSDASADERMFRTRAMFVELASRNHPDQVDGSSEVTRAVRAIASNPRIGIEERLRMAMGSGAFERSLTTPEPEFAAALLSAQDEFDRVMVIVAIAALGECGDLNDSARTAGPGLDWCRTLECASEVLRHTLPREVGEIRGTVRHAPASPADEPMIREALALLKDPLPEVADAVIEYELKRARADDSEMWWVRDWKLAPRTLDCLRKGL